MSSSFTGRSGRRRSPGPLPHHRLLTHSGLPLPYGRDPTGQGRERIRTAGGRTGRRPRRGEGGGRST
jgi:hypothetical protein